MASRPIRIRTIETSLYLLEYKKSPTTLQIHGSLMIYPISGVTIQSVTYSFI